MVSGAVVDDGGEKCNNHPPTPLLLLLLHPMLQVYWLAAHKHRKKCPHTLPLGPCCVMMVVVLVLVHEHSHRQAGSNTISSSVIFRHSYPQYRSAGRLFGWL